MPFEAEAPIYFRLVNVGIVARLLQQMERVQSSLVKVRRCDDRGNLEQAQMPRQGARDGALCLIDPTRS